ncbi:uncharacterized protein A4U43_C02F6310 [Asparagus officinalis]|uniref:Uncharacterized protein n=1 Tax=Asparagus officinalis TaxID=4686 RepID=A0A5P1FJ48_ASPOF|nr:putative UDP-rhamnose:rhamnosyltransferase 1 [Asparagus officinalis]ONK77417.1 uncharacterized protein A4U43_C02F6310 [Asparagus officinalis]
MAYKLHEVRRLFEMARLPNPSGVPDARRFKMALEGCRAIALWSCEELESEWLILLEEIIKKPIVPVGLLPPSVDERNENANESEVEIMEWLGKQRSKSVVYVALGTEVAMNTESLHELALGLETAELPFVWGLRKPFGLSPDGEILPEGFEDRTKDFGLVVKGWAPQVKILAHESVGGFLTHCGWSSIIEGLQSGHPLVLLPVDLDQGLNARLMEEKGFGVEVERNEEDGCFNKEDVAKALRLVMVDEEGESYRKRAQKMMEVVRDKERQDKNVDGFIQFLATNRSLEA